VLVPVGLTVVPVGVDVEVAVLVGVGVGVLLGVGVGVLLDVGVGDLVGAGLVWVVFFGAGLVLGLVVGANVPGCGLVADTGVRKEAGEDERAREGEAGGTTLSALAGALDPVGTGAVLADDCRPWEES
jgi:hypothetical protein